LDQVYYTSGLPIVIRRHNFHVRPLEFIQCNEPKTNKKCLDLVFRIESILLGTGIRNLWNTGSILICVNIKKLIQQYAKHSLLQTTRNKTVSYHIP